MWDVVIDALTDGVKVLPFLFLIYVLMEVIENARNKEKIEKALSGAGAPVMASLLGVVPECGFAVATAKLYDKGYACGGFSCRVRRRAYRSCFFGR